MQSHQITRAAARRTLALKKSVFKHGAVAALAAWGLLGAVAAQASPITVAVINGSTGNMGVASVAAQLNDDTYYDFTATVLAGNTVTNASTLSGFDVVLLGGSGSSPNEYSASTLAAVNSYMQAGGGVVTAGWYRFGVIFAGDQASADAVTPVVTAGNYEYAFNSIINFNNTVHDITNGVAAFGTPGCCIEVASALDANAVELGTADGKTAVAYQDAVGRSVYLGALYTANPSQYDVAALRSGDADRLLEQSVNWAARGGSGSGSGGGAFNANNVSEPGSLALVMAAVAALAVMRRRT